MKRKFYFTDIVRRLEALLHCDFLSPNMPVMTSLVTLKIEKKSRRTLPAARRPGSRTCGKSAATSTMLSMARKRQNG